MIYKSFKHTFLEGFQIIRTILSNVSKLLTKRKMKPFINNCVKLYLHMRLLLLEITKPVYILTPTPNSILTDASLLHTTHLKEPVSVFGESKSSAELQSEPSHWDQFRNCNITAAPLPPSHLFRTVWLQVGHTEEGGKGCGSGREQCTLGSSLQMKGMFW